MYQRQPKGLTHVTASEQVQEPNSHVGEQKTGVDCKR